MPTDTAEKVTEILERADRDARLIRLEAQLNELSRSRLKDPVSPRFLALSTVFLLVAALISLGMIKVLPGEVIAGVLGVLAGRLTTNLGASTSDSGDKP